MPQSPRFETLTCELSKLRGHFLPNQFEPTGAYTDQQLTNVIAYRVLAHAEIEAYLEDRVLEAASDAIKAWNDAGETRPTLLSLLAFCGLTMDIPPKTLNPQKGNKIVNPEKLKLNKKLELSSNAFYKSVKENHGLKEANILALLLPIGIDSEDLDSAWLSTMNTFGEQRGVVAHTSASSYKVTQPLDPKTEFETVNQVMKGLEDIDQFIDNLMN